MHTLGKYSSFYMPTSRGDTCRQQNANYMYPLWGIPYRLLCNNCIYTLSPNDRHSNSFLQHYCRDSFNSHMLGHMHSLSVVYMHVEGHSPHAPSDKPPPPPCDTHSEHQQYIMPPLKTRLLPPPPLYES